MAELLDPLGHIPDFTDEQFEQIIQKVITDRETKSSSDVARPQSTTTSTVSSSIAPIAAVDIGSLPKLNPGALPDSYYEVSKSGISRLRGEKLLSDKDRKLANELRKVEDPVVARQKAMEVCIVFSF